MSKLICTIVFISLALFSFGQARPDKDKERINSVCDKFMQNFHYGKITDAIQLLKQNSIMTHSDLDTLEATITNQITNILSMYGRILSYEFIKEKKIKDFIARRFYILKLEKYYLKFDFTLYNNGSAWRITYFRYNDDLIELLN